MQSNIASVCNLHFHDHISYTMTKCVNQTIVKNGAGSSLYHSLALLQIFACMRTEYLFNKVVLMETPRTKVNTIKIAFQGMLIIQHPSLFLFG